MEEDLWSKLMIAPLYNNALDGDVQMRQQWLTITNRYCTALHCTTVLQCTGQYFITLH